MLLNDLHILILKQSVNIPDQDQEFIEFIGKQENLTDSGQLPVKYTKSILIKLDYLSAKSKQQKTTAAGMNIPDDDKTDIISSYNNQLQAITELKECLLKIRKEEQEGAD